MSEWGWVILIGLGAAAAGFVVVRLATRRRPVDDRLYSQLAEDDDASMELVLGDMTDVLARSVPGEVRDRSELLPELLRAGYYRANALSQYRALRTVFVIVPLFAAATVAVLLVEPPVIPYVALGGVILAALGYSLPRLYVYLQAEARSREIERGLPVFADMMSITLLAGQGLISGLRRVAEQLRHSFPQLAEELTIVLRQTEMLNLGAAFEQWSNRSQLNEVRNLAVILNQSERLGNDVTNGLMEYATNLRATTRQRADAKAQRASFWMLFPTILCLWIPAVIILTMPVFFEFSERRAKAREAIPRMGPESDTMKALRRGKQKSDNAPLKVGEMKTERPPLLAK